MPPPVKECDEYQKQLAHAIQLLKGNKDNDSINAFEDGVVNARRALQGCEKREGDKKWAERREASLRKVALLTQW